MTVQPLAAVGVPDAQAPSRSGLGLALLAFIWLLPFHILAMAVLFGPLGLSASAVRAAAAWKEAAVAALFALVVARALGGHGRRLAIRAADVAVAGLGLLALVYLLGAQVWFGSDLPVGLQALGLRDAVFFTLVYFVGRAAPEVADDPRYLRALLTVGAVTCAIAVVERLLVTPQMLVVLGAAQFFQEYLGLAVTTSHNVYGLPDSYWTFLGSHAVQRAGSTYLSSQGFAVPFLVIVPAATLALLTARRARAWAWSAFVLVWIGLLLTVTRMTTVACGVEVLLVAGLYRRWGAVVRGAMVLTLATAATLAIVPGLAAFAVQSLTFESVSSVSHLKDWGEGLAHVARNPLGIGLGAGGLTAARFGLATIAADSQYFKYAVELGLPGLLLYLVVLGAFLAAGVGAYRSGRTPAARTYGALVAAGVVGLALNGITTVPLSSPFLAYSLFWLAGTAVSATDRRP